VTIHKNKTIFLFASHSSFSGGNTTVAYMLIVFVGLGFIFLGFILLYLLSIYSNGFVMYFLLALSVLSFAIGFHIILALVMHIIRVRKRRVVESEREGEAVGELAM